jgi:hypothetical protein
MAATASAAAFRQLTSKVGRLVDESGLEAVLEALADHCQARASFLANEHSDRQSAGTWLRLSARLAQAAVAAYDAGI